MRYNGINPNGINEVSQSVVAIYAGGEEKVFISGSSTTFNTSVSASAFSGSFYGNGENLAGVSPFRQTGSYWSAPFDLKITGSVDIDGLIRERARTLIPEILENLVYSHTAFNVFGGDILTDVNGETIIFSETDQDDAFPLSGSGLNVHRVSSHLIPLYNEVYDLGTPTRRWRDIYLSGSTIYLDVTRLSADSQGNLEVRNEAGDFSGIRANTVQIGSGSNVVNLSVTQDNRLAIVNDSNEVISNVGGSTSFQTLTGNPFSYVTGSNILNVTSSIFSIKTTSNQFSIFNNNGTSMFSVNNGVLKLQSLNTTPDPESGQLFYSSSNELFLGVG